MAKKVLGKGLGALLPELDNEKEGVIREVRISEIEPNQSQPRKRFDEEKIESLAESIRTHGIIQPIIVKRLETGFYQIIAGERRWRAAKIAGLKMIPVVVKDYDKRELIEVALIENLQREDLNPIEEAEAYYNLMQDYQLTQEEISARVGKSRSAIANALRLLNLPDSIKQMLIEEKITNGHARALLSIEENDLQEEIANKIIDEGLSVRQTEKLVKNLLSGKKKSVSQKKEDELSHVYVDLENRLSEKIGTKVRIYPGKNKSKIEIEYYTDDDLERIINQLMY
ncbi:MAG: ParB/RepB/Spo0J family partition protein [Clostridiaceae bacterium]|nr:ParB/RepB/Spo0J family partition protein [Clostridiaceae bacterium]